MNTGLIVARCQPLHKGHAWMINQAIQQCETVIFCLGSSQESQTIRNPWSFDDRKQMIKNVYGDRMKIIPLTDIGSTASTNEWTSYIFQKLSKLNLPEPNLCYIGSEVDSAWYQGIFNEKNNKKIVLTNRLTNDHISATEIRTSLQTQNDFWKSHVPEVNVNFIQKTFPASLVLK